MIPKQTLSLIIAFIFPAPNKQFLNITFRSFVGKRNGVVHFKDRQSLEAVQRLGVEVESMHNPIFEFFENRVNVLLANSALIHQVIKEIQKHKLYSCSWWLDGIFGLNDFLMYSGIFVYVILIFLNQHHNLIISWIVNTARRGYL